MMDVDDPTERVDKPMDEILITETCYNILANSLEHTSLTTKLS